MIDLVADRAGHDFRHSLECTKIYDMGVEIRDGFPQRATEDDRLALLELVVVV